MIIFLGEILKFKMIEDYLPKQQGKIIKLKDHQEEAINNLEEMIENGESIALLYNATGERVIIVMGAINAFKPRVSETLTE